jgi:hypothetical protein
MSIVARDGATQLAIRPWNAVHASCANGPIERLAAFTQLGRSGSRAEPMKLEFSRRPAGSHDARQPVGSAGL